MKRSTCEERWSGNILTQTFSLQVLEMNSDPLMSAQRLADRHTEVSTNPRHRIPNGQKGRAGLVSRRGCLVCWFLSVTCFFLKGGQGRCSSRIGTLATTNPPLNQHTSESTLVLTCHQAPRLSNCPRSQRSAPVHG